MVKYQVERRPIGPSGKIYRGTKPGDYIAVLSNPSKVLNADGGLSAAADISGSQVFTNSGTSTTVVSHSKYVPVGVPTPTLQTGSGAQSVEAKSHVVEQVGEPWLVHSTHFSVEAATQAAATLASAIGAENLRVVKVMTGITAFQLK